ncbi:MAG: flagellar basal body rod protein FlgC [Gammaproteobacteria bacterium]|nr:MAG: flagellar basal body rod protein FlgC [Gammaproteobacteria bacterium]
MSLFKVFDISGSALSAQTVRLNTTASNLANADTVSGDARSAYRARHPVFATVLEQAGGEGDAVAGVRVAGIVEDAAPVQKRYDPGNPLAGADGYVYTSNVNVVEEMVDMIAASRNYQSNVEVMNTAKQLLLATLRLGR